MEKMSRGFRRVTICAAKGAERKNGGGDLSTKKETIPLTVGKQGPKEEP